MPAIPAQQLDPLGGIDRGLPEVPGRGQAVGQQAERAHQSGLGALLPASHLFARAGHRLVRLAQRVACRPPPRRCDCAVLPDPPFTSIPTPSRGSPCRKCLRPHLRAAHHGIVQRPPKRAPGPGNEGAIADARGAQPEGRPRAGRPGAARPVMRGPKRPVWAASAAQFGQQGPIFVDGIYTRYVFTPACGPVSMA